MKTAVLPAPTFIFIVFILILTLQEHGAFSDDFRQVGALGGSVNALAAKGNIIFYNEGDQVVSARLEATGQLKELDRLCLGKTIQDIKTTGTLVLVGTFNWDQDGSLIVLDAQNPANLRQLSAVTTKTGVLDLDVYGRKAYVVSRYWLTIVDVATPAKPLVLSETRFQDLTAGIKVNNNRAYIASNVLQNFYVLDVTKPTTPTQIGFFKNYGGRDVRLQGQNAFVGGAIIDVSHPDAMQKLGSLPTSPFMPGPVVTTGSLAYMGMREFAGSTNCTVRCFDISAPQKVITLGEYVVGEEVDDLCLVNGMLLVAGGTTGLHVVNPTQPQNMTRKALIATVGNTQSVLVKDKLIYAGDAKTGLQIIDWTIPEKPKTLSKLATAGQMYALALSGTTLLSAGYTEGLRVIDVSVPTSPTVLARYATANEAWGVATTGTLAYVAAREYGLEVVDFSDRVHPRHAGQLNLGTTCLDVAMQGQYAYVVGFNPDVFAIVDISAPASPRKIASINLSSSPIKVVVKDNRVFLGMIYSQYTSNKLGGVQIIDISQKKSPQLLSFVKTSDTVLGLALGNNLIFASRNTSQWGDSYLQVISSGSPTSHLVSWGDTVAEDLCFAAPYLICAGRGNGVRILEYRNDANVEQGVPATTIDSNRITTLTLTLRNTGTSAWRPDNGYALKVIEDPGKLIKAGLPKMKGAIEATKTYQFSIPLTPDIAAKGNYRIRLQMGINSVGEFGPVIPLEITVQCRNAARCWDLYN